MFEPIPLQHQSYSNFYHSYSSGRLSVGYVDELCGVVFDSVSEYAVESQSYNHRSLLHRVIYIYI